MVACMYALASIPRRVSSEHSKNRFSTASWRLQWACRAAWKVARRSTASESARTGSPAICIRVWCCACVFRYASVMPYRATQAHMRNARSAEDVLQHTGNTHSAQHSPTAPGVFRGPCTHGAHHVTHVCRFRTCYAYAKHGPHRHRHECGKA